MIEVNHISKSFSGIKILKNIHTTMESGKMNMIIGKSGGGKTVLMKILLGLFEPDEGDILYDNISFSKGTKEQKKQLMSKIGMVFQGSALFDSMSVLENVMMPLNFYSKDKYNVKLQRVKDSLSRVNLTQAIHKRTNELSGGMKKRVAIARAIILNPTYFFLDEPNSDLDPQTSLLIDQLIHELTTEKKMTTIINTHDMNSILTMGDNINFMSQGSLLWRGHHSQIEHSDNLLLKQFVFANRYASLEIS